MNILGISAFGQNPAACLLSKGRLIAFAEEERFLRLKSAYGYSPLNAVKYCLKEAGLSLKDIKTVAVGWDHNKYRFQIPLFLIKSWLKYGHISGDSSILPSLKELLSQHPTLTKKRISLDLKKLGLKVKTPPIKFFSHHLSHAASTFYASGFKDSAIIIMDGSGENDATTIYHGNGLSIKQVQQIKIPHSLGWFYAGLGAYLGFKPYEQDGFLMGLAPYGKPNTKIAHQIKKIIKLTKNGYTVDPQYTLMGRHTYNQHFSDSLVKLFGKPRLHHQPITQHHKNIAYAAQNALEQAALHLAHISLQQTNSSNLCLAGGVALNIKMNGRIKESGLFDHMFIQPVSHDAGVALGAAMLASREFGHDPRFTMKHTYFGPSFSDSQIAATLKEAKVPYKKPGNITDKVAAAVAKGKIVAWFQDRMEVGPRALGNRSILADPTTKGINDYINDNVKHRDPWRPFCPSFTSHGSKDYFLGESESHYMIVGYDITKKLRSKIPAVIHVDGSARPQTVLKSTNPKYHEIIKKVGKLTGVECVLNTSLNVKGEPIARTPEDALRCFYSTGIDFLALGPFWLEK